LNKQIIEWVARECYPPNWDTTVFSSEFRSPIVAHGFLTKCKLLEIVKWKAQRVLPLADQNTEQTVRAVTRDAFVAADSDPREAIQLLCDLHGVQVRMASAILAVWAPTRYTVMDRRSCTALRRWDVGYTDTRFTPDSYAGYLDRCQQLAHKHRVSLRQLDRFLWVWGGGQ